LGYNTKSLWVPHCLFLFFLSSVIQLHWSLSFTNIAICFLFLILQLFTCFHFAWNSFPPT
jgi:hypothetical protein